MEFNLEIRRKQLESLKQYIKSSEDNVKAVFQSLGWNINKSVQDEDSKIMCPVNKHHLILEKATSTHVEKCSLKAAGYKDDEQYLSEVPMNSETCVKLPKMKKIELFSAVKATKPEFKSLWSHLHKWPHKYHFYNHISFCTWNGRDPDPLTSDRYISTFSVDERLALHEYSIKHTKGPPKPNEFTLELSDSKEKKVVSEKDRLMLERDSKRRRTKYKSVHTSKKSQTEVMREVIENQMALYTDWVRQKQEKESREKERLQRLAKEKKRRKAVSTNSDMYSPYGDTGYYGNQTGSYSSVPAFQTNQGVITDWSHVYQGGIDTDVYMNSDQAPESSYAIPNLSLNNSNNHHSQASNASHVYYDNTVYQAQDSYEQNKTTSKNPWESKKY